MLRLGATVRRTPANHMVTAMRQRDAIAAWAIAPGIGLEIYTDGSTKTTGETPEAGWGWIGFAENDARRSDEVVVGRDKGRVHGAQQNYKAEAQAALDALLQVHPTTPVTLYIDNLAVVQRFDVNL